MGFCTVKYGASREIIINPDCTTVSLLNHLKQYCNQQHLAESLDLSTEDGEIVDLNSKTKENAKQYLEDRCVYVLVKVICEEGCEEFTYVPLCESYEKIKFAISTNAKKSKQKSHLQKDREASILAMDSAIDDKKKGINAKNVPQKKK